MRFRKGDDYEEIVGAVQRALDPGAKVGVGEWAEGPDGRRDRDVHVYGTRDGKPIRVLVECKDWKRRVGIGAIDALESKRRDLGVDLAVVYSNSGFTRPALRKATRTGIECASALVAGDKRVRVRLEREFIAPRLSVDQWALKVFFPKDKATGFPEHFDPRELTWGGLPVLNWIQKTSADLLREHDGKSEIVATYAFKEPTVLEMSGIPIELTGIQLRLQCSKRWYVQPVSADVSTGLYDHIAGKAIVPSQQGYILGPFKPEAWREVDPKTLQEEKDLAPGEFSLGMVLMNPVRGIPGKDAPNLDSAIGEKESRATD